MVKELSMDNIIFNLGSTSELKANDLSVDSSVNEFERVFETTNTKYADKKDLQVDSKKVANVAEKSVSQDRSKQEVKREQSANVTMSNKTKVSEKTSSKSPKTATKTTDSKQTTGVDKQASSQKEADTITDAYAFSVKESLNEGKSIEPKEEINNIAEEKTGLLASAIIDTLVDEIPVILEQNVNQNSFATNVDVNTEISLNGSEATFAQVLTNKAVEKLTEKLSTDTTQQVGHRRWRTC